MKLLTFAILRKSQFLFCKSRGGDFFFHATNMISRSARWVQYEGWEKLRRTAKKKDIFYPKAHSFFET